MFSQLFGNYLIEKEIIKKEEYAAAIQKQLSVRVKLGTIAIAEGLLTEEEVDNINKLQMQFDKRFGDIAIEKGLLTLEQIGELLDKQGNPYMQFIESLTECTKLSAAVLDKTLSAFQKEKGFSDADMTALKNDNLDSLIPIFAFSAKPHVTELAGLVVRNINRFITRNFYIGKIKHVDSFDYCNLAGQKTVGNDDIYLAFADADNNGAFTMLASNFSGEKHAEADGNAFDAVCEFINVNSGLYASELSKKDIDLDMEPVFAYKDQTVKGDFYVLPIYLEDSQINLIIAVNTEMTMGNTPFTYASKENIVYDADPNAKGTVLLVDDSRMSRKMLKNLLEEEGYAVIAEAGDGLEAIEAYKTHKPDLVTLDITMPNMDGIEALTELIAIDPDIKAVMITAAGQQNKLIQALKIGAKKFITKPFEKEEVINNINEVME